MLQICDLAYGSWANTV